MLAWRSVVLLVPVMIILVKLMTRLFESLVQSALLSTLRTELGDQKMSGHMPTMFSKLFCAARCSAWVAKVFSDMLEVLESFAPSWRSSTDDKMEKSGPVSEEEMKDAMSFHVQEWRGFEKLTRLCGTGACPGEVCLVQQNSAQYAAKQIATAWVGESSEQFAAQHPGEYEQPWFDAACVKVLNDRMFPFACLLDGVYRDHESTYFVTEFASEGDLYSYFSSMRTVCPEPKVRHIFQQICAATRDLHNLGIGHRDLSAENILLSGGLSVKIIDFGMATLQRSCRDALRGKVAYQAPEMHEGEYDVFLTDSFSLGVVLFCMAAQDCPWACTEAGMCFFFDCMRVRGLRTLLGRKYMRHTNRTLAESFSESLIELLEGLLCTKAEKRLTLGEACWEQCPSPRKSVWDTQWMREASAF